jgi:hypothetical protein
MNDSLDKSPDSVQKPILKCLSKPTNCTNVECETFIECIDPKLSKNCYAMTKNNFQVNTSDTFQKYPHIYSAGCWAGGEECRPPNDLLLKKDGKTSYELPLSLREPSIQEKCIAYSSEHDVSSFWYRNNLSFCCCSTPLCNENVIVSRERNPHELNLQMRNPQINNTRGIRLKPSNEYNDNGIDLKIVNAGLMTGILTFSLIFVIVLLFTVLAFMYKKKFFFKNLASLPPIFFTKNRESSEFNLSNNNNNNTSANLLDPVKGTPKVTDSLNEKNTRLTALDDAQLIQPLLQQSQQQFAFPSAVIAPNVVISDKPIANMSLFNSMNSVKKNHVPSNKFTNSNFPSESPELISEDDSNHSTSSIKAVDINLLEKISHGQFSTVWKGERKTKTDPNEVYYAIKIFSGSQKTAWFNEKEIYNKLVKSPNENILKYFGTDTHMPNKQEQQKQPEKPPFFFPNFPTSEFWLITEYHYCGSLHDFLKANYVSWPQLVNLCNCILEGLAYLHNEHVDTRKECAIAHRDLKSKNILVKNGGLSCCIGDLGLALKLNNANKLNSAEISTMVNQ